MNNVIIFSLLFGSKTFLFCCTFPRSDFVFSKTSQTICGIKLNDSHLRPSTAQLYHHWHITSPAWNSPITHASSRRKYKTSSKEFQRNMLSLYFILIVPVTCAVPEEPSRMWSELHTRREKGSMLPSSSQLEPREKPQPWGRWTSCLTLTTKGSSTFMMPLRRRTLSSSLLRCILFIIFYRERTFRVWILST